VEGLVSNKELLSKDQMIVPELIVYEVANALWKQEYLLKRLKNGQLYLSSLYDLIDTGKITVIFPDESLMKEAYLMAKQKGITTYDAIFVCLAVKLGLTLKTLDRKQSQALETERKEEEM
jgi:predicted nucleic acid-binding protein